MDSDALEGRIVDVEVCLAHQQDLLQKLNEALIGQSKEIETLSRRVLLLERRLEHPGALEEDSGPEDDSAGAAG